MRVTDVTDVTDRNNYVANPLPQLKANEQNTFIDDISSGNSTAPRYPYFFRSEKTQECNFAR